jgi:hypothetical protein|tara:strand:+ start:5512 stop:5757 length:246 start_codon:yes stop_codon:yes gene_type:complete
MKNISLDDFLSDGIIKEKDFREKVSSTDWSKYQDQKVIIKGCSKAAVPTWAYLIITANLTKFAKRIYFGEPCSAIDIYKNS